MTALAIPVSISPSVPIAVSVLPFFAFGFGTSSFLARSVVGRDVYITVLGGHGEPWRFGVGMEISDGFAWTSMGEKAVEKKVVRGV
jgi:hypothetical protein